MPRPDTLSAVLGLLELKATIEIPPAGLYANPEEAFHALQAHNEMPSGDEVSHFDSKCQLAAICLQRQLKDQAMRLLQETAAGRTRVLGPNHPSTLIARELMSYTLVGQSKYREAQFECEAVHRGRVESLGPHHRSTIQSKFNLALLSWFQGDYESGINQMRQAASHAQEALGETDFFALLINENSVYMLHLDESDMEAMTIQKRVLKTRMEVRPQDNAEILKSALLASTIYQALEWWKENLEAYRIVAQKREALQGRHHPATIDSLSNLAKALDNADQYREAGALYAETTHTLRVMHGRVNPRVMMEDVRLAIVLMHLNDMDGALQLLEDVISCYKANEALEPTVGCFAMQAASEVLVRLDRKDDAKVMLTECQAMRESLMDPYDLNVLLENIRAAYLLLELEEADEADRIIYSAIDRARSSRMCYNAKLDLELKVLVSNLLAVGKTSTFNKYHGLE